MSEARPERTPTRREELANSVSHGIGLVVLIAALPVLLEAAAEEGGPVALAASAIFGGSAMLVYLTSTVLHALPEGRAKRVAGTVDHAAIYVLIAGTYTPFTLGVLWDGWGWLLLGLVWGLAAVGVALTIGWCDRFPGVMIGLYLGMGWLVLIAARTVCLRVPLPGLLLIGGGGVAYTLGVAFYVARSLRYGHLIWHVFVMVGTSCHFLAVLWYAA